MDSFTAATPVLLASGNAKPIGKLQVGDEVTATDPISGITRTEPVVALYEHQDLELADVTITDGTGRTARINTTQNHPFWSATTGKWTPAAQLQPGEQLRKPDGTTVTVTAVLTWTQSKPMYNIGVSDLHTYYVIADGIPVLVHNIDPDMVLYRFGAGPETVEGLRNSAADAIANDPPFPHGVSTSNRLPSRMAESGEYRSTTVGQLNQAGFEVEQTGKRKAHHTIHLPNPVTEAHADALNGVLKGCDP